MKIKYTYIERIEITGPAHGSDAAFEYCVTYGYRIVRSGPKRINAMRVDSSKFQIIAEREMAQKSQNKAHDLTDKTKGSAV